MTDCKQLSSTNEGFTDEFSKVGISALFWMSVDEVWFFVDSLLKQLNL